MLPASVAVLNWLVRGQLTNSFHRAVRFWVIINNIYGDAHWANELGSGWSYPDLRCRLFRASHPTQDNLKAQAISTNCDDSSCLCHLSCQQLLGIMPEQELMSLTNKTETQVEELIAGYPFATVHRSLRADLKILTDMGWFKSLPQGQYACVNANRLPKFSQQSQIVPLNFLSVRQQVEFMHGLETLSWIQPNLEPLLTSLSQTILGTSSTKLTEHQRIFIELDYILNKSLQEEVDDIQAIIEDLWHRAEGGVIQFKYSVDWQGSPIKVEVYPVCIHYVRRAKYLSAFGQDLYGKIDWHNYRLDQILPPSLKVLAWGDPRVPDQLKIMREQGNLPDPSYVRSEMSKAWGFKFYAPARLAILRFSSKFSDRYVANTIRHNTFTEIPYSELSSLLKREIKDSAELNTILNILKKRSPKDVYYQVQIREDDINIIHRMRDWRPKGELIAPLSLRNRMVTEALAEIENYQT